MSEIGQRMLDGSKQPDARQIAAWLGPVNYKRWKNIDSDGVLADVKRFLVVKRKPKRT
jgi:hypothetical protein